MAVIVGLLVVLVGVILLFPAVDRALEKIDIKNNLGELENDK